MNCSEAREVFAREAILQEGAVPRSLSSALKTTSTYSISRDAFLLNLPNGLRLGYQRGMGVTVARPETVPEDEVALFLNGSVYGAIAWINGYVPLHAASVADERGVHAFGGPSGIGKSTLAATLGARGLPLYSDDVLVLDLGNPDIIMCIPGHSGSKLWDDALDLVGVEPIKKIRHTHDKFYAVPASGSCQAPLPLVRLSILDFQAREEESIKPLKGAERFARISATFYRPHFGLAILGYRTVFEIVDRISRQARVDIFDRPKDKTIFAEGVDLIAEEIVR